MNHIIGYAIAIAMPILFYLYIFAIFNKTNAIVEINTFTKSDWYISIFIFVSITCAIAVLIKQNQFIYYWDYGREWTTALSVSDELFVNPINALKSIYASINSTDYNQLMPVLIILPLKILGNSFARYVVVNMVFYMCPALFMISLLAYKILHKYQINGTKFWNIVLFVSLTPILYYVLLDGFMDAPVLILISGLLMLSLELDFEKVDIVACVEMAVGILMLVLFRRHFAYWVVGYIVSIFFIAVYHIEKEKDRFRKFKVYVMDMLIIGGICLSVLLTVFRQFFLRSVFNNFSYAYSAYNVTYAEKFERIVVVFGWGVLFMAFILAPIVCRWYKGLFAITISYFIHIALATFLLWRELQMNWHQYYLIVIQVILLASVGLFGLAERKKKKNQILIKLAGVIWGLINVGVCFVPIFQGTNIYHLFSTRYYETKTRNDLESIHEMIDYVNEIANPENGKWVYVLSSSGVLNSDILRKAELPFNINPIPTLYGTREVDLRDGFPEELFQADVVIVGEPVQTHLPDGKQQIISHLSELILDSDSYLGKHYSCVKKFVLDGGVTANVYNRISQYDKEDYVKLQTYFDDLYGEYPELFGNRIVYPTAFFPDKVGEKIILAQEDKIFGTNCGEDVDHLVSISEGHLVYGPGKRIEKGIYNVTFKYDYDGKIKAGESLGIVDVCLSLNVIASSDFKAGDSKIRLEHVKIDDPDDKCEVRMYVNVPGVKFQSVTIEKVE